MNLSKNPELAINTSEAELYSNHRAVFSAFCATVLLIAPAGCGHAYEALTDHSIQGVLPLRVQRAEELSRMQGELEVLKMRRDARLRIKSAGFQNKTVGDFLRSKGLVQDFVDANKAGVQRKKIPTTGTEEMGEMCSKSETVIKCLRILAVDQEADAERGIIPGFPDESL